MVRWKRDLIYGIGLLAGCIAIFCETWGLQAGTAKLWSVRADVYVWMWLVILAILGVGLILRALRFKSTEMLPAIWGKSGIFTVVALAVYLVLMGWVGFLISTVLFVLATLIMYSWDMGRLEGMKGNALVKKMIIYVIFSVIVTFATYYIFKYGLDVRLPEGSLF